MLNGAKRSEASPEGYRNLGKSRSCQHSGILQDCFHRAGALESLQRFALQNDTVLPRVSRFGLSSEAVKVIKTKRKRSSAHGEAVSFVIAKHYCAYYNSSLPPQALSRTCAAWERLMAESSALMDATTISIQNEATSSCYLHRIMVTVLSTTQILMPIWKTWSR